MACPESAQNNAHGSRAISLDKTVGSESAMVSGFEITDFFSKLGRWLSAVFFFRPIDRDKSFNIVGNLDSQLRRRLLCFEFQGPSNEYSGCQKAYSIPVGHLTLAAPTNRS